MAKTKNLIFIAIFIVFGYCGTVNAANNTDTSACKSQGDSCSMEDGSLGQCYDPGTFSSWKCASLDNAGTDTSACEDDGDMSCAVGDTIGKCVSKSMGGWMCVIGAQEKSDEGGNPAPDGEFPGGNPAPSGPSNSGNYVMDGLYIPTADETGLSDSSIQDILMNLLTWMLGIVGVIALIGFVISGIQYIISVGDEKAIETAKKNMMYSIMGVVVVLASLVIVQAIDFALRGRSYF